MFSMRSVEMFGWPSLKYPASCTELSAILQDLGGSKLDEEAAIKSLEFDTGREKKAQTSK
jgi:hypothetical protein